MSPGVLFFLRTEPACLTQGAHTCLALSSTLAAQDPMGHLATGTPGSRRGAPASVPSCCTSPGAQKGSSKRKGQAQPARSPHGPMEVLQCTANTLWCRGLGSEDAALQPHPHPGSTTAAAVRARVSLTQLVGLLVSPPLPHNTSPRRGLQRVLTPARGPGKEAGEELVRHVNRLGATDVSATQRGPGTEAVRERKHQQPCLQQFSW